MFLSTLRISFEKFEFGIRHFESSWPRKRFRLNRLAQKVRHWRAHSSGVFEIVQTFLFKTFDLGMYSPYSDQSDVGLNKNNRSPLLYDPKHRLISYLTKSQPIDWIFQSPNEWKMNHHRSRRRFFLYGFTWSLKSWRQHYYCDAVMVSYVDDFGDRIHNSVDQ